MINKISSSIGKAKTQFRGKYPDFKDFENPGELYFKDERGYKDRAIARATPYFRFLEEGDPAKFWSNFSPLIADSNDKAGIGLNFISWRDKDSIIKTIKDREEVFAPIIADLIKNDSVSWEKPLSELCEMLSHHGAPPNITKLLPMSIATISLKDVRKSSIQAQLRNILMESADTFLVLSPITH